MKIKALQDSLCRPGLTLTLFNRDFDLCFCHRRPDRSFLFYRNKPVLCARCTGIFIGIVLGFALRLSGILSNPWYGIIFLIPLVIDGTIQFFWRYESTNLRRCITGILFGIGIILVITGHY